MIQLEFQKLFRGEYRKIQKTQRKTFNRNAEMMIMVIVQVQFAK